MKNSTKELNTNHKRELMMKEMEQVTGGFAWLKPSPKGPGTDPEPGGATGGWTSDELPEKDEPGGVTGGW